MDGDAFILLILRYILVFVLLFNLASCGGKRIPVTDYNIGYNRAVKEYREGNIFEKSGLELVAGFSVDRDDNKSADWNTGYRKGIIDEQAR